MGIFHFVALGITLLLASEGRYATLLTIRSVLRTAFLRSAQLRSADASLEKRHFEMHPLNSDGNLGKHQIADK